jgi:TonB family protein
MKNLPGYFLEANLYLLAFLAFYFIFLKKETHFQFNRAFLLLSMLTALAFPLVSLPVSSGPAFIQSISHSIQTYWLPEVVVSAGTKQASIWEALLPNDIRTGIAWVYVAGMIVFLLIFLIQLIQLLRLIRKARTYRWNQCLVAESNAVNQIFSFFHFIFIGSTFPLTSEEKEKILRHEKVHAARWHSLDMLLCELLNVLFWFNPLLRLYQKNLVQTHEFEADAETVSDGETNEYCHLLARVTLQSAGIPLANHFNQNLTLKRISMMQARKKKMRHWKIAALMALFPAAFLIISCQKQGMEEDTKPDQPAPTKTHSMTAHLDQIYMVVEQMPEFPGGVPALIQFLSREIHYPSESLRKGIEGTVFISFVIDEQGKVIDPQVVKGMDAACDQEALRVIKLSPKWIPGMQNGKTVKVKYTLPIRFELSDDQANLVAPDHITAETKEIKVSMETLKKNGKSIIRGRLTDQTGKPLWGANVVFADHYMGTTTGKDGYFSMELEASTGELEISREGYPTQKLRF